MSDAQGGIALAWILLIFMLPMIGGCEGNPETGAKAVKWDREICERCRMVLSDRKHSAQVRFFPEGKGSRVLLFDDIGCAALWLREQPWQNDPRTEIWVTDHRTGEWIDARSASYVEGHLTPMEYGLGAQVDPIAGGLSYEQAVARILEVEAHFNAHGVDLMKRLEELKAAREGRSPAPIQVPREIEK